MKEVARFFHIPEVFSQLQKLVHLFLCVSDAWIAEETDTCISNGAEVVSRKSQTNTVVLVQVYELSFGGWLTFVISLLGHN